MTSKPLYVVGCALLACALGGAGCQTSGGLAAMSRPGPAQVNAYRVSEWLPPQIRRVAVLPLTADTADPALEAGLVPLEPVLRSELAKCDLFELVFVPAEQMRRWTGQRNWTAEETLPVDFFKRLQEEYGCNAVLFSRLTRYQAYAPLQMGWNLKLIESENPRIRWAVDEVFDAGQAAVADEAKRYAAHNLSDGRPLADGGSILMSPTRFGQYSISSVLGTLPKR